MKTFMKLLWVMVIGIIVSTTVVEATSGLLNKSTALSLLATSRK